MAAADNLVIEQLKDVGNRLLQPPSSTPELLKLLDELELLLLKIGQSPSKLVQETLLLSMKALIADELLRNSDADVRVTVAACLNELTRISAPVAPFDDEKMKEIFELIVSSFEKLSCRAGRCYSKAVLILENVAKVQSSVMMLDLDCDELIAKMFELFVNNISPDHPHSVFLAMEKIMRVMIEESDAVSQELLKVLLASTRKENQDVSPTSWKLGARVIEVCAEKLKPYIMTMVKSMGYCLEDYAPILSSICKNEPDTVKNLGDDSAKHVVTAKPSADKSVTAEYGQSLKAIEHCSQTTVAKTDFKAVTESGSTAFKKGRKANSGNPDEGYENVSGKGRTSLGSSHHYPKKSSIAVKDEEKSMPLEDVASKVKTEEAADLEHKELPEAMPLGDSSKKKKRLLKKNISGGSRTKGQTEEVASPEHKELHQAAPLGDSRRKKGRLQKKDVSSGSVSGGSGNKSATGRSRKSKSEMSDASNSQRKRASLDDDDDVIETPHGRKNYKEDLVGSRIKVWWPLDRSYYEGTITSFDASTKKHRVDYDDGDEEILNLRKERWEFLGEETVGDLELLANRQTSQPPVDVPQREVSTDGEKEASEKHTGEKGKGAVPDSGAKSGEGSPQVTKAIEKSKTPEVPTETKRPRLSDGQSS